MDQPFIAVWETPDRYIVTTGKGTPSSDLQQNNEGSYSFKVGRRIAFHQALNKTIDLDPQYVTRKFFKKLDAGKSTQDHDLATYTEFYHWVKGEWRRR